MNGTVNKIKELRGKIAKLENHYKDGMSPFEGFTIDVSYGGNSKTDISRISVGSVSDDKDLTLTFYNLILTSLKNSLKFTVSSAKNELAELTNCLDND